MEAQNAPRARVPESMPEFKLLLVGDGGVGKTELIERLKNDPSVDSSELHVESLNITIQRLVFYTNRGPIKFNVWDTAGQEKFGGLSDGYYTQGQCAIIMGDATSRMTFYNLANWHRDLTRVCKNIPIVLVGNNPTAAEPSSLVLPRRFGRVPRYGVSTNFNVNLWKPFLRIARMLSGDDHLMFVERPNAAIRVEAEPAHEADLAAGR